MNINLSRAILAGVIGTIVMTVMSVLIAPMMGMPAMNPAEMLAGQMGGNIMMGWAAHFMVGIVLAVLYALVASRLPGPAAVRGALFGLAPWLLAQAVMMPMMGMGMFSGSMMLAGGSLVGHLLYGGTVGLVYGVPTSSN